MKKIASVLSVFLLILAACSNSNTPQTVAKQYVSVIYAGDVDAAFKLFYFNESDKKKLVWKT